MFGCWRVKSDPDLFELGQFKLDDYLVVSDSLLFNASPEFDKFFLCQTPTFVRIHRRKVISRGHSGLQSNPMADKSFFINFPTFVLPEEAENLNCFVLTLLRKLNTFFSVADKLVKEVVNFLAVVKATNLDLRYTILPAF